MPSRGLLHVSLSSRNEISLQSYYGSENLLHDSLSHKFYYVRMLFNAVRESATDFVDRHGTTAVEIVRETTIYSGIRIRARLTTYVKNNGLMILVNRA